MQSCVEQKSPFADDDEWVLQSVRAAQPPNNPRAKQVTKSATRTSRRRYQRGLGLSLPRSMTTSQNSELIASTTKPPKKNPISSQSVAPINTTAPQATPAERAKQDGVP